MKVTCPSCKREIPPEDINIQSAIAKCSACGEFFMLGNNQQGVAAPAGKPQVAMPKNITVFRDMNALIIKRHWFSWTVIPLTLFAVAWDSFLILFYSAAIAGHAPLTFMLFPLIHLSVGVFITYTVLTGYLNSTEVRITGGSISVLHGPLPWPGNKVLTTENIQQVYCIQSNFTNNRSVTYDLCALYKCGTREKLISGIDQPEQARFIEQQIEAVLGIADAPVAGEMGAV